MFNPHARYRIKATLWTSIYTKFATSLAKKEECFNWFFNVLQEVITGAPVDPIAVEIFKGECRSQAERTALHLDKEVSHG